MALMNKIFVNISMVDLLTSIPKYSKFLKELITNKERLDEDGVVTLSEKCSYIIRKDIYISKKSKDPGSCTILCDIGSKHFSKALCDLGSGVSLIPLAIAQSIGMGDNVKSTQVTLQLADKTLVKPSGVIEDVLVKVDKFILLVDFIVLDIEIDDDCPVIFGRPFLATGDAIIGVKDKTITFRVNGEEVCFDVNYVMKYPREDVGCFRVDVLKECTKEVIEDENCIDVRMMEVFSIFPSHSSMLFDMDDEDRMIEGQICDLVENCFVDNSILKIMGNGKKW